jgi:hypothetical protein
VNWTSIEMPFWGPPRSFIASARKRGLLNGIVRVVPSSFTWDGHLIEVDEAWLQKSPSQNSTILYFSLHIDGKLQYLRDWPYFADQLIFREDGTENIAGIGQKSWTNKLERMKAFIPGVGSYHGWVTHKVSFRNDNVPKLLRLRAGREENFIAVLSEQTLVFDLTSRE